MLFGKTKKIEELEKQLSCSEEKIASLEKELADMKLREFAIAKAMTDANVAAETILAQAREESGKTKEQARLELAEAETRSGSIRAEANEKASRVVAEAEEKAAKVVSEAEGKGNTILAEAEEKSQKRLKETEDEVRSYAEVLVKLNENMKEQARLAQEASERYAAFYHQMSVSLPGIMSSLTGGQLPEGELNGKIAEPASKSDASVTKVSDILAGDPVAETVSTEDILNSI